MFFRFGRRRTFGRNESTNISVLEDSLANISVSPCDKNDLNHDDGDSNDSVRTGPLGLNQLSSPPEALVELVFVHGLGGGSRKSWSHSKHEEHFWPKSWLPRDPDFQNARIHSFGYKSAKSEIISTVAGIPEFAESLLTALRDSPVIRRSQNAIVLIGHSMGGLAFIQAHASETFKGLAGRIRSLYFFGTPHAGSDFTQTFQTLLKFFPIIRETENVADLAPTSRLLESLNESFPRVAENIEICSFCETQQSDILGKKRYVVPKHSARLYYKKEVCYYLDANHREMCKYDKPANPNYIKVRNALSASVETIVRQYTLRNQAAHTKTLQSLRELLDVLEPPEDDFEDYYESCLSEDACSWFISGHSYRAWRDQIRSEVKMDAIVPNLILIEAEPGAGKSVLTAQVINNLQALNYECSYYFFDSQDQQKSRLSRLLRSLAFQMALLSPSVRQRLLDLQQQNVTIPSDSDKSIWRKVFTNCIFQSPLERQHYWVIDGLDECQQATSILQMFLRIDPGTQLKIFMTTRPEESIHREILPYSNKVTHVRLSKTDTLPSMHAYVEARTQHLRLRREEDRVELVRSILDNADGSFLWVKLVLDDVSKATSPQQIEKSIQNIPRGMNRLYTDIVERLNHEIPQEEIPATKAFLNWALCANPPLTVGELEAALKLEKLDNFVDRMCEKLRNLIVIDHGNKVRAIHKTARTFLLTSDIESDFVISSKNAHKRITDLLVKHLHARLRGIRNANHLNHWHQRKAGLDNYALLYFSDHLRRTLDHNDYKTRLHDGSSRGHDRDTSPEDQNLFLEVAEFFADCGNSWIASIASTGSLVPLIKTSQNLRYWLQTRAKSTPPLGELAQKTTRMQQWTVDLVRLVAKFGRHLLEFPGAIYVLVPSFVPKESVLSIDRPRQTRGQNKVSVTGFSNERWDDRLCSMFYQGTTCTAVASGKQSFAVALRNGTVHVYDNVTLQISRTVRHGAVVKLLKYDDTGSMLLSAGFRRVRMWVIPEGNQMWEVAVRDPLLAAEFIDENRTLISISSQHKLIKQDAATGAIIKATQRRPNVLFDEGEETLPFFRRELHYAEFSAQAAMLATMQRERPIQLSDIEDRYEIGIVELEMSDDGDYGTTEQPITAMAFCANLDVALLAIAYRDGILAVFDRDLRLIEKRGDNKAVSLIAGSPDGLTLAAASVEGVITLYDFEHLIPLHVIFTFSYENIRSLVFSGDGYRIIDIRDRQANLWAPAALVSRVREDSDSLSKSTLSPTVATSDWTGLKDGVVDITAVVPITNSEQFICGREDGRIVIHSTGDANKEKLLYTVADKQWIDRLVWKAKNRILASVSGTSTVTVSVLAPDWSVKTVLLRHVFLHPVLQLLFQETAECLRMAVVTTRTVSLWLAECPLTEQCSLTESRVQTFDNNGLFLEDAPDPTSVSHYVTLVEPDRLRNYSWEDLEEVGSRKHLSFCLPAGRSPTDAAQGGQENIITFDRATSLSGEGHRILLRSVSSQTTTLSPSASTPTKSCNRKRWILDLTQPNPATIDTLSQPTSTTGAALRANLLPVSHLIEHVIGIRNEGKQLIFLSKALWVCSYDLVLASTKARRLSTDHRVGEYTRHLFIPDDWISSNYNNATSQLLFVLGGTKEDCLVFVKKHEIAVIREPFSHAEKIRIS